MMNAGQVKRRRNMDRGVLDFNQTINYKSPVLIPPTLGTFLPSFKAMNTIVQAQLDRVEAALHILIESVASFNPSIPAANALLAADDDLNKGLKQCMNRPARRPCSRFLPTPPTI